MFRFFTSRTSFARLILVIPLLALLVAVSVVRPTGTVHAHSLDTCVGTGCNGRDPQTYGCDANTSTIYNIILGDYNAYQMGNLEMRWSNNCLTNWTRLTEYVGCGTLPGGENDCVTAWKAKLYYSPGYCQFYYYADGSYGAGTGSSIWTPQYYAPNSPVDSYGSITESNPSYQAYYSVANPGWGTLCYS
jgi:Protein of unknown function (DUF2690)